MGKSYYESATYVHVNEGLWANSGIANALNMGDSHPSGTKGNSKTDYPVINIAGIETEVKDIGLAPAYNRSRIKFPEAPNGTVTYDSATGVITDYTTDVDPKYGDVATTTNEAVARAFEGLLRNADFRFGDDGRWTEGITTRGSVYVDTTGVLLVKDGTEGAKLSTQASFYTGGGLLQAGDEIIIDVDVDLSGTGEGQVLLGNSQWVYGLTQGHNRIKVTLTETLSKIRFYFSHTSNSGHSIKFSNVRVLVPTTEVVTERVDMFGFEGWLEEVTASQPFVYPNGLIQSKAATMNGISTSASSRPATYYAVFDGDTGSVGKGVDFINASNDNKRKMFSEPKNNMYWIEGKPYQWRVRQRTVAGAGNGDWAYIDSNQIGNVPLCSKYIGGHLRSQGYRATVGGSSVWTRTYFGQDKVSHHSDRAIAKSTNGGWTLDTSTGVDGHCYFLVCGTVPRLNQGAFHPSFNPMGTRNWNSDHSAIDGEAWSHSLVDAQVGSLCFKQVHANNAHGTWYTIASAIESGSISSASSGRPDGKFYDAIYASGQGGVIDYRLSAWDKSSPEEASKVDALVKNGSYRGVEKLKFTKPLDLGTSSSKWLSGSNWTVYFPSPNTILTIDIKAAINTSDSSRIASAKFVDSNGDIFDVVGRYTSGALDYLVFISGGPEPYIAGNCYLMYESSTETNISVSGKFTQDVLYGDPALILQDADMKNGWMGSWGGARVLSTPLGRKCLTSTIVREYRTASEVWAAQADLTIDSIHNDTNVTYGLTEFLFVHFDAFAKQTKVANNEPVFNGEAGVGSVAYANYYSTARYSLLCESLIGKVCTSNNAGGLLSTSSPLNNIGLNPSTGELDNSTYRLSRHSPLDLVTPSNNSIGFKALNYQVEANQQLSTNYAYKELIYDTDWGDNDKINIADKQTTLTDLNGNTVLTGTATLAIPYGWSKNNV